MSAMKNRLRITAGCQCVDVVFFGDCCCWTAYKSFRVTFHTFFYSSLFQFSFRFQFHLRVTLCLQPDPLVFMCKFLIFFAGCFSQNLHFENSTSFCLLLRINLLLAADFGSKKFTSQVIYAFLFIYFPFRWILWNWKKVKWMV